MSNVLLKLIKFGIGFILFIPLYIGGSFFFPFIFPKIWLFQLVIEIILFFYVILAISDNRYRPKLNWATYALAALTIILIITSFTSIDVFRSFWGNTERMSGVIAWFHFVVFALILSGILRTEKEWRNFLGIAVSVSILEFFYVLAQYFGASWVWIPGSQMGTIGNTDLLGSYAIFSAFFALYLWRNNLKSDFKNSPKSDFGWIWIIAFFLNIGTLFLASSRGAILGFGAGIFVYALFYFWQKPEIRKTLGLIVLAVAILYGSLWLMKDRSFIKNNKQLNRIIQISLKDDTVQQRFTEWGIAWSAFKAKPIFGFGPNNYLYLHNLFLNPRVYNLRETNFDRAHNAYLDYASMSGILGVLGYIFLIFVLFWVFFKNRIWSFASLMAAYAVQSFFVFDSPASYIALFLTIGFAMHEAGNPKSQILNSKQISNSKPLNSQTILAISIFYFLFSIFLVWQVSVKPMIANSKFVSAYNDPSFTPEQSFGLYKEALKYETLGSSEFRNQYINWLQNNIAKFQPENRLEVLDFGIDQLKKEIKIHPSVFTYLNLGQLYYFKARGTQDVSLRQGLLENAMAAFNEALKLAPKRLEVYYAYLQLTFDTKEYNKGIELMKKATLEAPNYWQTYWYLGLAYTAAGNNEEAVLAINKAMAVFYNRKDIIIENGRLKYDYVKVADYASSFAPKQEILGAVNPYIRLQMWPELLLLYLSAEKSDPGDIKLHQSLALVYQNLGLNDKVQEELKIIDSLKK